ncbi:MAG: hypothetical protein U9Q30_10190 [Campylobacterota bacterium]|nr:hypothetical protein [Campylobacterota bacterium]
MKAIIALEKLIKEEEKRISVAKKQLSDDEAGINKLTFLTKASTEETLEKSKLSLDKHKAMLSEIMKGDIKELEEKEKLQEAMQRKKYHDYQKIRLKRDKTAPNDVKLVAMSVLDEISSDITFEDKELIDLGKIIIELELNTIEEIFNLFRDIQKDFHSLKDKIKEEDINSLGITDVYIPLIILSIAVLVSNIKENNFHGFPKFEDWWISELWVNHQAYMGLYKWKNIIRNQCNTTDQQRIWEVIFSNWIFLKKLIKGKGKQAYELNFIFDSLIKQYGELEEELEIENIKRIDNIIEELTTKEDFTKTVSNHNIETDYLKFKQTRIK